MLRKAQHIAELTIIIGVIMMVFSAISLYIQRGLQGRYKQFADSAFSEFNNVEEVQYEPYYLRQKFQTESLDSEQFDYKKGENFKRRSYSEAKSSGQRQELSYINQTTEEVIVKPMEP